MHHLSEERGGDPTFITLDGREECDQFWKHLGVEQGSDIEKLEIPAKAASTTTASTSKKTPAVRLLRLSDEDDGKEMKLSFVAKVSEIARMSLCVCLYACLCKCGAFVASK
jgi:hypothetical protein